MTKKGFTQSRVAYWDPMELEEFVNNFTIFAILRPFGDYFVHSLLLFPSL